MDMARVQIVPTSQRQTATLFFFHGSGGTGIAMKEWLDEINGEEFKFPHIRIIYPTAPAQPNTFKGLVENVWYDFIRRSVDVPEQRESINMICQTISELIQQETNNGIPPNRIMFAGFSLGGGLALHLAYRIYPTVVACATMSSYLTKDSMVYEELAKREMENVPPLFQSHGTADQLVPFPMAENLRENLQGLRVDVEFVPSIDTGHVLSKLQVQRFKEWILKVLPDDFM